VLRNPRIKRIQRSLLFRSRLIISRRFTEAACSFKSIARIEAMPYKSLVGFCLHEICRERMLPIVADRNIVVRQRVVQLRVVYQINTACDGTKFIAVLPHRLFL